MRNTITKLRSFLAGLALGIGARRALVELHERGLRATYYGNLWVVYDTAMYSPWEPRASLAQALQAYLDEKGEGQ